MKRLLVFIILLISSTILFPQTETFEKLYDSGTGYTVKEAADGYYVIGSVDGDYISILKTDASGNLLWKSGNYLKHFGSASFEFAADGGILYTGYFEGGNGTIGLIKLDKDGNLLWRKELGSRDREEVGLAITKTRDGNFVVFGGGNNSTDYNVLEYVNYGTLIKVDNNGDTLWVKSNLTEIGYTLRRDAVAKISELSDASLAVSFHITLLKYSSAGELMGSFSAGIGYNVAFCEGVDSNIYISKLNNLRKCSSTGTLIKSKTIQGLTGESIVPSFVEKEFLVSNKNALLVINDNLDTLAQHPFLGTINSIAKTKDGHYLLTGTNATNKLWLVKTDQNFSYKSLFVLTPEMNSKQRWGDSLYVTWQSFNASGNVTIEFSQDNGNAWQTVAASIQDNQKYTWAVPSIVSSKCKIKVSKSDTPSFFSESDLFTIHPNMNSDTLSINNILMWVRNDGQSAHDPRTDGSGLYWPRESGSWTIFEDGLIWSGKVNGEIRANGSAYRTGTVPGNILANGKGADPLDMSFGIWKIRRDDSQLSPIQKEINTFNYQNWPKDLGAPFANGKPYSLGDETAFFVANDLDTVKSQYFAGSNPIGLEIQHTIYGYKSDGFLGDVLFKNYEMINKSNYTIDSMYIGLWSDGDLGDAGDDYVGCDSALNLAYFYNGDNDDKYFYGIAPPAIGYTVLQGVVAKGNNNDSVIVEGNWKNGYKDLGMTTFIPILKGPFSGPIDFMQGSYQGSIELNNLMKGRINNGSLFLGWKSGLPLGHYPFGGDPETQIGMVEGPNSDVAIYPGDRRLGLSSGPFTFAPGDTQTVTIAILLARGSSNLNSVTKLKEKTQLVKDFYNQYLTDVKNDKPSTQPNEFALYQNYPNPFNPETIINYQLSVNSKVSLKVYDILGNEVITLVNEEQKAGLYKVNFNTQQTTNNQQLASGVYFYKLTAGNFVQTKKFVLIK